MPNVGTTSTGANNQYDWYGVNNMNMVFWQVTMPEDGDINSISCYFSGNGASVAARICLWDSSYNSQRQSSQFTQPSGTQTVNGQSWVTQSISSYRATKNSKVFIGFYRAGSGGHIMSYKNSGGTFYTKIASSYTQDCDNGTGQAGIPCFYLTYTPAPKGGIKVYSGSFAKHPVKVYNGSSWIRRPVKVWNGSSWVWRA